MLGAILLIAAAVAQPIVIGHRGASGERPEHTIASYERAIAVGADYIEPDLVMTKDGVLVARHENNIADTTDVAAHPEFAARKTTKTIDGERMTGWFTEDFTLGEVKTLYARERLPKLRPGNLAWDKERVPTLSEIIALVRAREKTTHRRIGLYPEIKHSTYFAGIGLPMERALVTQLARAGYSKSTDPVFIQSFEVGNLKFLHMITRLKLLQLIGDGSVPPDAPMLTSAVMTSPAGLRAIARYAQAIGPQKSLVIPVTSVGSMGAPTALVRDAHAAGLLVHAWTFRAENAFLPEALQRGDDPRAHGDMQAELRAFFTAGVDGVFSDFPGEAVAARTNRR